MNKSLPKKKDFDPDNGNLDAIEAWKVFGGLTVVQAHTKFMQRPEIYQESFMFMGTQAFLFYSPVLKKYLKTIEPVDCEDDCALRIIGCGVQSQFEDSPRKTKNIAHILSEIVLSRLPTLKFNNDDKKRVAMKWKLVNQLTSDDFLILNQ